MKHPEKNMKHMPPPDQPLMWRQEWFPHTNNMLHLSFVSPWQIFKILNKPPGYIYTVAYHLQCLNEFRKTKTKTKTTDEPFK